MEEITNRPTAAIILGAGRGTRLKNITSPYTKTILPINDLPVIGYAVRAVEPFVDRIILVAHPSTVNEVHKAAKNGLRDNSREIEITIQNHPLGMADAMRIGFTALKEDYTVVVLAGDNIILDIQNVKNTLDAVRLSDSGQIKLTWTFRELLPDAARRFSVYQDLGGGRGKLIEKPENPPSKICWCGPVAFDSSSEAFQRIEELSPSLRGEYEATDLMNTYISKGESSYIKLLGQWFDIGTPESLEAARIAIQNNN